MFPLPSRPQAAKDSPVRRAALLLVVALIAAACASDGQASPSSTITPGEAIDPAVSAVVPPTAPFIAPTDARPGVPVTPSRYRVAIYGDSMAHSVQELLVENLDAGGRLDPQIRIFAGAALCDYLDDIEADTAPNSAEPPLWGAILMFSNNTFTPCMADESGVPLTGDAAFDKFQSDLRQAFTQLSEAGVQVWMPNVPITRAIAEGANDHLTPLNQASAALTLEFDNVYAVDAAAAVLQPDGSYAETLPCLPLEPCTGGVDASGEGFNFVRETDGVHFCTSGWAEGADIIPGSCPAYSSGAFRYAAAITAPVITVAAADWSAEASE